jgi:uncharacterized protein (DUF2235 family)
MKRLVCSIDGAWDDGGEPWPLTNVAKLHAAILPKDRRGVRQLVRYISGIATNEDLRFAFLRRAVGFKTGARIKIAYQFLQDTYEPGDEIYLFGFSCGAFEARSLASFVTLFGIARSGSNFSFDEAWKLYRQSDHKRDVDTLARLSAACHYPVAIRCVGVWDSVGSIGNPFVGAARISRLAKFHDMRLHDTIGVALHGLSIDETRGALRPILFTVPDGTTLAAHQHVEQMWFAGTHGDVGGGWPDSALSDIALIWMAKRAAALTGLAIDIRGLKRSAASDPLGVQHYSATGWRSAFSRLMPFIRLVAQDVSAIPKLRRFFGSWRTGKLDPGLISLNETVHESALTRLGQSVAEARGKSVKDIIYLPRSLLGAETAPGDVAEAKYSGTSFTQD